MVFLFLLASMIDDENPNFCISTWLEKYFMPNVGSFLNGKTTSLCFSARPYIFQFPVTQNTTQEYILLKHHIAVFKYLFCIWWDVKRFVKSSAFTYFSYEVECIVFTVSNVKSHQMLSEHSHLGSIVGTTLPFNRGLICKAEELSTWVSTVKKGNPPPIQGALPQGLFLAQVLIIRRTLPYMDPYLQK